jgi:tetratricopeptide (TPR) repeat protein
LLGCALPSGLHAQSADATAPQERALAAAEASLQEGRLDAAEGQYRRALFEGWLATGRLETLEGRLSEAREALEKAAEVVAEAAQGRRRDLAEAFARAGDSRRSGAILEELVLLDPRDVESRRMLARVLDARGERAQALARLGEGVALAAGDAEATFLLATEYLWLKEVDTAARLFASVVEARPIPQTRILVGRAYRDAGEYGRARIELVAALRQDPSVRRAHYYLGMVALADAAAAERLKTAEAEFREELKLAPDDPLTNDQMGLALLDAIRPGEALPFLETAVRGEPRALFLLHLGRCQLALDRPAEAVASLRRALSQAGEQGTDDLELEQIHFQLGQALRRTGAQAEAVAQLGLAGKLAARRREAAAQSSVPVGQLRAAFGAAEASSGAVPSERRAELQQRAAAGLARAYFNLGVIEAQRHGNEPAADRFTRAASQFERAAALEPEFPRVQASLGIARFSAGQFANAVAPLSRALAASPQDADLRRMLATAYLNTQSWEEASTLLRDDPGRANDASLQLAYGLALVRSGRAAEAEPVLVALAALQGESAELSQLLGEAYRQLGRTEEAERQFAASKRLSARPVVKP